MYVELMLHYDNEGTRSIATCYANFIFVLVTHTLLGMHLGLLTQCLTVIQRYF